MRLKNVTGMGAMRLRGDLDSFTEEILKEMNKIFISSKKHGQKISFKYLFSNKYLKTYSVVRFRFRYKPKKNRFIGLLKPNRNPKKNSVQ